jgi:hypothetical protein
MKKAGVLHDHEGLSKKLYTYPGGNGLGKRDAQCFHKLFR